MTLGEKIRFKREEKGLTQAALAELVGAGSAKVVSNWEKDINEPGIQKVSIMCSVFSVPASYFIDGPIDPNDITTDQRDILQKIQMLDEIGKQVVTSVLDSQVTRCRDSGKYVETPISPVEGNIFLSPNDKDYKKCRDKLPALQKLKKDAHTTSDTIATLLWYRGYNGKISIADIVLIFLGLRIPSLQLFDDIEDILKRSKKL